MLVLLSLLIFIVSAPAPPVTSRLVEALRVILSLPSPPFRELFSLFIINVSLPLPPLITLLLPCSTVILSERSEPFITLLLPRILRMALSFNSAFTPKFEPLRVITPVFGFKEY